MLATLSRATHSPPSFRVLRPYFYVWLGTIRFQTHVAESELYVLRPAPSHSPQRVILGRNRALHVGYFSLWSTISPRAASVLVEKMVCSSSRPLPRATRAHAHLHGFSRSQLKSGVQLAYGARSG